MSKTILLPTDFSNNATNAIYYAIKLLGDEGCDFVLFHAISIPINTMDGLATHIPQQVEEETRMIEETATKMREALPENSTVRTRIETGMNVPSLINDAAIEEDAHLIVLGTQGATGLSEILVGSNTEGLIRHTKFPVIAVPENAQFVEPKNILFAADLTAAENESILNPLTEIATKYDSLITILTVEKEGNGTTAEQMIESYNLHKQLGDVAHKYDVAVGNNAHEQIECYLAANGTDLLVTIARHNHFWDRLFHTSVTGKLAMHTTVPMLALQDE